MISWQSGSMKPIREFNTHVRGEELFGTPLPDADLQELEIYSSTAANLAELLMWGNQLIQGGPPVDRKLLAQLKAEQKSSEVAAEQLRELTKFVNWYRTSYAISMLQELQAVDPAQES